MLDCLPNVPTRERQNKSFFYSPMIKSLKFFKNPISISDKDVDEVLEEEEEELLLLLQAGELHQLNEVEVEPLHHQDQLNLPLLNHLLKQEDKHKLIRVQEQYHKETKNKCLSQIVMILIKKHA